MTVALALVAALLFALGNVLQQRVAMGFPDRLANSALFLLRLGRDPVWLLGTAVILLGFVFHAAALASGQIVVAGRQHHKLPPTHRPCGTDRVYQRQRRTHRRSRLRVRCCQGRFPLVARR